MRKVITIKCPKCGKEITIVLIGEFKKKPEPKWHIAWRAAC